MLKSESATQPHRDIPAGHVCDDPQVHAGTSRSHVAGQTAAVAADPARFGTEAETLDHYESYMNIFEDELLDGRIFPSFTDQVRRHPRPPVPSPTAQRKAVALKN